MVPGEDLVGPGDDGVDCVVVLGQLAGLVEVAEPSEGLEGAVVVVGEVEAVELLQCLPAGPQAVWVPIIRPFAETWDEGLLAPVGVIMSRGCRGLRSWQGTKDRFGAAAERGRQP